MAEYSVKTELMDLYRHRGRVKAVLILTTIFYSVHADTHTHIFTYKRQLKIAVIDILDCF